MHKGKTEDLHLSTFISKCLHHAEFRIFRLDYAIFPYLRPFYYAHTDKEYLQNVKVLRGYFKSLLDQRRKESDLKDDLLGVMLKDEFFRNNEEDMIDEIMIYFIAGSSTIGVTTINFMIYMMLNPECKKKMMEEIN